jgi:hypothetical protein
MLVLEVWFTRLSSTGSRKVVSINSTKPNLRCPRNGQADEPFGSASVTQATERLEQALGKATEVVSASPDTGQQGGGAPKNAPLNRSSTVGEGGESTQSWFKS